MLVCDPAQQQAALLEQLVAVVVDGDDRVRRAMGLAPRRSLLELDHADEVDHIWDCGSCEALHRRLIGFVLEDGQPRAAYTYEWAQHSGDAVHEARVLVSVGDWSDQGTPDGRAHFCARMRDVGHSIGYQLLDDSHGDQGIFGPLIGSLQARDDERLKLVWRIVDHVASYDERVQALERWLAERPGR